MLSGGDGERRAMRVRLCQKCQNERTNMNRSNRAQRSSDLSATKKQKNVDGSEKEISSTREPSTTL